MALAYDLYWSFRSPYSYLVTQRLVALEEEYEVAANVRVVYPIAVRQPGFFAHSDPLWFSYFRCDVFRSADFVGLPFAWPSPDPVVMDPQTLAISKEQPYIHRLTRLGQVAAERGRGLAFIDQVSRVIWGGKTRNWHEGDQLARAAERAGLDLAEMDAAVAAEPERLDRTIEASQEAQRAGGHYGVPLMVFDGAPFFGQDRFDQLKWRMQQKGLTARGR
jgi:2-hydroxychromene-2-carboxylate isomerase